MVVSDKSFVSLTSHNGCAVTKAYRQFSVNLLYAARELLAGRSLVFTRRGSSCCPFCCNVAP
jgi:hypothetical protein